MHDSALMKMAAFRDVYLQPPARILDVGSWSEHGDGHRDLFGDYDYVGLDIVDGPNVDVVPADPYRWTELETGSFDAVVSGQVFEHNPYFWITAAETARVTKPGGMICLVAPSAGEVHRYPLDCWRFWPDAGAALCGYVGLELVESYVESGTHRTVNGAEWRDWMMIARRPADIDLLHLEMIVATRRAFPEPRLEEGPAISAYEAQVRITDADWKRARLRQEVLLWTARGRRLVRPG